MRITSVSANAPERTEPDLLNFIEFERVLPSHAVSDGRADLDRSAVIVRPSSIPQHALSIAHCRYVSWWWFVGVWSATPRDWTHSDAALYCIEQVSVTYRDDDRYRRCYNCLWPWYGRLIGQSARRVELSVKSAGQVYSAASSARCDVSRRVRRSPLTPAVAKRKLARAAASHPSESARDAHSSVHGAGSASDAEITRARSD